MMDEFLDTLVHHWHNIKQAQSNPQNFAYVHFLWYYDDGVLKTKQWYDYNPNEPYRERTHRVYERDNLVILETDKAADCVWSRTPKGWVGKSDPNWEHPNKVKVLTKARLEKNLFAIDDKGWDQRGNLIWGTEKGPFVFTQCDTK